jgi:DNA helicase II / ATP-dependent DNA helicase PcrA
MAIPESVFIAAVKEKIGKELNAEQLEIIVSPSNKNLNIVAGPGSGKTTVMVIRILYLIFVHKYEPKTILATSFTKKAAKQIRSRLLTWSDILISLWLDDEEFYNSHNWLNNLNFNAITSGTLDSIIQDIISPILRRLNEPPLVACDEVILRSIALRQVWKYELTKCDDFITYMDTCLPQADIKINYQRVRKIINQIVNFNERFINDIVDEEEFFASQKHAGAEIFEKALASYREELGNYGLCSFSLLQRRFYEVLQNGEADTEVCGFRTIFVDEFQDTNAIQEAIYFELLRRSKSQNNCNLVVVGDDDQSLYRFRGATVEIFLEHEKRIWAQLEQKTNTYYLFKNYRSTPNIIDACNEFLHIDEDFQSIRPKGKPLIVSANKKRPNFPILGLFRPTRGEISRELSSILHSITSKGLTVCLNDGTKEKLEGNHFNQICLLSHSPKEVRGNTRRLAGLLSDNLGSEKIFNYRGINIGEDRVIGIICGLILFCLDSDLEVQDECLSNYQQSLVIVPFDNWRNEASDYLHSLDSGGNSSLQKYIDEWNERKSLHGGEISDVYITSLIYDLLYWMPELSNQPETFLRLEVITRAIENLALITPYQMNIRGRKYRERSAENNDNYSVKRIMMHLLFPLSEGEFDVDEELIEIPPRNSISIMSIHQSKGLEFPMVVVDVGSDFKTNHFMQEMLRFPTGEGYDQAMEDLLRPYSSAFQGWPNGRTNSARRFDDLIRRTFVAFSRAEIALLLVGQSEKDSISPNLKIQNIQYAYDRNANLHLNWWRDIVLL